MATSTIKNLFRHTSGNATKASSNISEVEFASWEKIGRVCYVKIKFTNSVIISNTTEALFTGFPKPTQIVIADAHCATDVATGTISTGITTKSKILQVFSLDETVGHNILVRVNGGYYYLASVRWGQTTLESNAEYNIRIIYE